MSVHPQHARSNDGVLGQIEIYQGEYNDLQRLVKDVTGIHLAKDRRSMVQRRLGGRLKANNVSSFAEYCDIIRSGDAVETEHFINAVTTNLTAFFREAHHFDMLKDDMFPKLIASAKRSGEAIRIWCAGCSTGEEPYSVAMVLAEMASCTTGVDVRILATDLDSDVLVQCKSGIYTTERVEHMPEERLHRWFSPGRGANAGFVRIKSQLQEMVAFKQLNLMHTWPMSKPFDIVFCRNVIIYFDDDTQKKMAERFSRVMKPDSYLFLGHSENIMSITDRFTLLGRSVYALTHS